MAETEKKKKEKKSKAKEEDKKPVDSRKILLVTGANRGIGLEIIDTLLEKKTKLRLIMTARNDELGQQKYNELCEKYPEDKERFFYHQLDITNEESITELINWIKTTFKKIDYLCNNAGVSNKGTDFNIETFNFTFNTNVYGTINFIDKMLTSSVFNKQGKIILVTGKSSLSKIKDEKLMTKFKNAKNADDAIKLADSFKDSIENNTVDEDGWYKNTFGVGTMVMNTYAKVVIKRREISKEQLSVYAVHPGWVKTEMGGEFAKVEVKDAANQIIYLIELPDGINKEFQGKFFEECKVSNFD